MRALWRQFGNWLESTVLPFVDEHPVKSQLLLWGTLLGLGMIASIADHGVTFTSGAGMFAVSFGWVFLVALAWWAGDWDIQYRRRRVHWMRKNRICPHCGYDLRASPGRCPECGKRMDDPVEGT